MSEASGDRNDQRGRGRGGSGRGTGRGATGGAGGRSSSGRGGQGRGRDERDEGRAGRGTGHERGAPAGLDRARESAAPPPMPLRGRARPSAADEAAPPEPEWPSAVTVDLPRGVKHELSNQVRGGKGMVEKVMQALTIGGDAIDDGEPAFALRYLEWAKHHAPRSAAIREALGVARYLTEDYAGATTELQAYRRMTGHRDQNHVLADCLRATGGSTARIGELVSEMEPGRDGADRYAEGVIVWASALADAGDVGAGRAVLRRLLDDAGAARARAPEEHDLRLWYVAGDLAQRDGDTDAADAWFSRIVAHVGEDWFDVTERLAALRS